MRAGRNIVIDSCTNPTGRLTEQCRETIHLDQTLRSLNIGTYCNPSPEHDNPYYPIATATMQTAVFDVVHMFSELGISAVPIVDANGKVINLYETVDVIVSSMMLFQA